MSGLAAYCFFPKKPMLQLEREIDNQLPSFSYFSIELTLFKGISFFNLMLIYNVSDEDYSL